MSHKDKMFGKAATLSDICSGIVVTKKTMNFTSNTILTFVSNRVPLRQKLISFMPTNFNFCTTSNYFSCNTKLF